MIDEQIVVSIDATQAVKKYRQLAAEFERDAESFLAALDGTRATPETAQAKAIEYGVLKGKAYAYNKVAENFEALQKK